MPHANLHENQEAALDLLRQAGIALRPDETENMEVLDFGLGDPATIGAQIVHVADTERIAIRVIALLPGQILPEHTHPAAAGGGKEETIRCHWGLLYLYGPGADTQDPSVAPPEDRRRFFTVRHEYALGPGEQVTFPPGTPHWFAAGPGGAVVWSLSSRAIDKKDIFTDPAVVR